MFEVSWENFICKSRDIFDNKRTAIFSPADDTFVLGVLDRYLSTSMMRNVLARKIGIVFNISSRLDYYDALNIILIMFLLFKR